MLRAVLLSLAGVALAAALALGVFFASEAALGEDEPPLAPQAPLTQRTTTGGTTTVRTQSTPTLDAPTPTVTGGTETEDDGGRGRGRNRGRGGGGDDNSGSGSDDD
jgi:hypothetical protein